MLREFLPRVVVTLVLFSGAYFAFFESIYLQDQAAEVGEVKIAMWMWVFRGLTAALVIGAVAILIPTAKRLLAS